MSFLLLEERTMMTFQMKEGTLRKVEKRATANIRERVSMLAGFVKKEFSNNNEKKVSCWTMAIPMANGMIVPFIPKTIRPCIW